MHAVVIHVNIEDFDRARTNLQENVVPQVRQAPGFVAGYWTQLAEDRGIGMMVFDSENSARAAAEQARSAPRVAAEITDIQIAEVVAHA
jgi:hypothetical protein